MDYRLGGDNVKCDPSSRIITQQNITQAQFKGFAPNQDSLDLLSRFVPDVITIQCGGDEYYVSKDARAATSGSFRFNLLGFPNL